jgi:hypothetical protein
MFLPGRRIRAFHARTTCRPKVSKLYLLDPVIDYTDVPSDVTFAEIKLRLSQDEHLRAESGDGTIFLGESSPSSFIVAGIELESTQYAF